MHDQYTTGDVEAWVRRIREVDEADHPDLLTLISDIRRFLERLVPLVAEALDTIHPLSCRFDGVFAKAAKAAGLDPGDVALDPVREAVSDAVGVSGLYDLADRLANAGPDSCDCRAHGCAELAGIPTDRAD